MVLADVEPHPLNRQTSSVPLAHARSGKEAMLAVVLSKTTEQSARHSVVRENRRANVVATQSHVPIRPERAIARRVLAPLVSVFLADRDRPCELS